VRISRATVASLATTTVIALVVVLLAPVARVLFLRLFVFGEDRGFATAGVVGLITYASPALAAVFRRVPTRITAATGLAVLVGARLGVQFVHPVPPWLAFGATVAALVGATSVLIGLADRRSLRMLQVALVAGLAIDSAVRIPAASWEPVWRSGILPSSLAIGTAVLATVALVAATREQVIDRDAGVPAAAVASIGPFLMLQLVFLQNLGWVGSQASVPFPVAAAVVLAGDAIAIGTAALLHLRRERLRMVAVIVLGTVTAALTTLLPVVEGGWALGLTLGLSVATTACLTITADLGAAASRARLVRAATGASLAFFLLAMLWLLSIDRPLPFPRTVVPTIAGLWLAGSALAASRACRSRVPRRESMTELAGAASIVAVCLVAIAPVAIAWPVSESTAVDRAIVRVVSFNVRGAVGPDAMLDIDAIVRSIEAGDPDVVVLQEVARGWPIFGAGDLLAALERRLDMSSRFEPAADGQFGNAVLSRYSMTPIAAGPLPEVPGKQRRSFLTVSVDTSAGPLVVTGTHLEADSTDQIDALLATLDEGVPTIVAGDMNMERTDTSSVRRFEAAGLIDAETATGDPCRTTSAEPTSSCDRPDWVWVSDDLEIVRVAIGQASASDHLPIEVTVST
jgi:endonuclease/exonuclease/phosphatase family metal-dependent hydrolase